MPELRHSGSTLTVVRPGAVVKARDGHRVGEVIDVHDTRFGVELVIRVGLLFPIAGICPEDWVASATASELRLNRSAGEVLARLPVRAGAGAAGD